MTRRRRWAAVASVLLLAPICAELLQAYDDSTGRPGRVLFAIVFFAALYGAPALLIREFCRRRGLGWRGIVLLACAAGLIEAGLIDQSLFTVDYRDIAEAEASTRATWVPWFGLGAYNVPSWVGGHVLFSFCVPIAIAEGVGDDRDRWLGWPGLLLAAIAWAGSAVLVWADTVRSEQGASIGQVIGTILVVLALVGAALRLGPVRRRSGRVPPAWWAATVAFLLVTLPLFAGENWAGFVATCIAYAALAWFLASRGSRPGWTRRHTVAVALGIVLSRGLLAFTYYPLVGDPTAVQKYGHNVVTLAIVLIVGVVAWRSAAARTDVAGRS